MAKRVVSVPFPKFALLRRDEGRGRISFWRYLCSDERYLYLLRVSESPAPKNSRAPTRWDIRAVEGLLGTTIVHIEECICPQWMVTGDMSAKEQSRTVEKRNMLLWMLEAGGDWLVTDEKRLNELLKETSAIFGRKVPYIRALLTRYFYYAGHVNALMSLHRYKGAPGISRMGTTSKKMGRPNDNMVLNPKTTFNGRNMTRRILVKWKQVLWEDFVHNNYTMAQSLERLMLQLGGFNRDKDGLIKFFPTDPRKLPERSVFFRYASVLISDFSMLKKKMGSVQWHQKYAARTGTSEDLCLDAIDIYDMDGMEFNIELVEEKNKKRIRNIGKPLVILAVDRRSTAVVGWFVSLGRENSMAYRYCLFNAFTPKTDRLKKSGVGHLRGFVHGCAEQIVVDRGPAVSRLSTKALTEVMRVDMLITKPGQGESKSIVENVNGRFQHRLSNLKGAFRRTRFKRDQAQHAKAEATASVTYKKFTNLLLHAISDHNLFTPVSSKLKTEMRLAGVKPNPKSIFLWHRSMKRGDAAHEWPESLVYKRLLRRDERLAPLGVVTWEGNEYSSTGLAQYFNTWNGAPHGKEKSPCVIVYQLEEDENILLWEKPDGALATLEKRRGDTNSAALIELWQRREYNRLDNASEREQRVKNQKNGTLSRAKASVLDAADGRTKLPLKPGDKARHRKTAHDENNAGIVQEALETLGIVGVPSAHMLDAIRPSAGYVRAIESDDDLEVDW
jgi:hypothetical protein